MKQKQRDKPACKAYLSSSVLCCRRGAGAVDAVMTQITFLKIFFTKGQEKFHRINGNIS
jgi:hypothetical protein